MSYKRIIQAFSLPYVIKKYALRQNLDLHVYHVRVLFVMRSVGNPWTRRSILLYLAARGIAQNYTQLNKIISFMLAKDIIILQSQTPIKRFQITPKGLEILMILEKQIRTVRWD